ncbi:hypothetical protein LX36DRAFT_660690 [Colletotrichum falcatum]|nr:hypothetical protein LX36DRAFT_660690 [Colletotrichum falcatum]
MSWSPGFRARHMRAGAASRRWLASTARAPRRERYSASRRVPLRVVKPKPKGLRSRSPTLHETESRGRLLPHLRYTPLCRKRHGPPLPWLYLRVFGPFDRVNGTLHSGGGVFENIGFAAEVGMGPAGPGAPPWCPSQRVADETASRANAERCRGFADAVEDPEYRASPSGSAMDMSLVSKISKGGNGAGPTLTRIRGSNTVVSGPDCSQWVYPRLKSPKTMRCFTDEANKGRRYIEPQS